MKEAVVLFAIIGVWAIACIIFVLLYCFEQWAVGKLDDYRWKKKYKNRFNRSPTAECFCNDCIRYDRKGNYCRFFEHYTPDVGFCYRADPHLFDIDKLEEKEEIKNENSKN